MGKVANMEVGKFSYWVLVNLKERDCLEDLVVVEVTKINLK